MSTTTGQRRPKGTGSLRHLGGDRWQVTIKQGSTRLSRVFHARNATEANRAADAVRVDLLTDRTRQKNAVGVEREQRRGFTVEQYVEHYFSEWAPHNLQNTTRRRYRQVADNQIIPRIGRVRMAEVTPADLTAMYAALATKGAGRYGRTLSGPTIWTVHAVMRAIFTFAVEVQGDFPTNPAASKVARPRVPKDGSKRRALDVEQVEQFVAISRAKAPEIAVPVMLSAYLGTRRGETLALRWSDVDFEACEVTIRRAVTQTPNDGVAIKSTKTDKERTVPLDAHTVVELKATQRAQRERRLALGRGWQGADTPDDDYIAAALDGSITAPNDFSNGFRTLAKQNGLAHITPHLLRHAWVSQMIALGFDAVTIATMTGHSPDVLMRTYAHAFDRRKREAVDALGAAREAARAAVCGE